MRGLVQCEKWPQPRPEPPSPGDGGSFWYEIWPSIELAMPTDRYPDHPRLAEIARIGADRWRQARLDLADRRGVPDSAIPLTTSAPASRSTTDAGSSLTVRPEWPGSSTRPGRNRATPTISSPRRVASGFSRSKRPIRIMRCSCPTVPDRRVRERRTGSNVRHGSATRLVLRDQRLPGRLGRDGRPLGRS